jgi:hypothetical protein
LLSPKVLFISSLLTAVLVKFKTPVEKAEEEYTAEEK